MARLVGQQLQEELKQPFVVENKPGAQGAIAAAEVARAAPDGYTLLVTTNTPQAANVSLFKKLAYDPVKDFAPVARIGTTSFMLMVRADSPIKTLKEFLADARAKPGKLSAGYGSSGSQVSLAMLKSMGKLDVVEVPVQGHSAGGHRRARRHALVHLRGPGQRARAGEGRQAERGSR